MEESIAQAEGGDEDTKSAGKQSECSTGAFEKPQSYSNCSSSYSSSSSSSSSQSQRNEKRASRWEVKQPAGVRLTWGSIQYSTSSSTSYVPRVSFCYPVNLSSQHAPNISNKNCVLLYHKKDFNSRHTPFNVPKPNVNTFNSSSSSSSPQNSEVTFYNTPSVAPATNSTLASPPTVVAASPSTISSSPILVCSALSSTLLRALEEDSSGDSVREDDSKDILEDDETIAYWKKEESTHKTSNSTNSSPSLYRPPSPLQSRKGKEKDEDDEAIDEHVIQDEVQDLLFQFDDGRLVLSIESHLKRANDLRLNHESSTTHHPHQHKHHRQIHNEKEKEDDDDEEDDFYDESCDEDDRPRLEACDETPETQNPLLMLENIRQTQLKALELLEKLLNEDASPQHICQVSEELDKLNELERHYINLCSESGSSSSRVMKTDLTEDDFSCPICWSDISASDGRTLAACDHRYCKDCLAEYFSSKIREAQVLTLKCPHPECSATPEVYELEYLLEREVYHKYLEFAVIANLKTDKNAKWCPTLGCGNVIVADPDLSVVKCFSCKKEFCFHCLKWHPGRECNEASFEATTEEDRQFIAWLDNMKNNVHSCPRCNISIEKNKGCNHMQCTSCSYQFCWLCGKEYSSIHYNEGECAGKQFIETEEIEAPIVPVAPPLEEGTQDIMLVKKPRKGKLSRVASYVALGIAAPPLLVIGVPIVIYKAVKRKNAKKAASKSVVL